MEERLDNEVSWAINPFVHNPYQKDYVYTNGRATPTQDAELPHNLQMITIQQMQVVQEMNIALKRKGSLDARAMAMTEKIATPKASYAELFYDLFFVASLTSFGLTHEITQAQAIASYVAFFTILWYYLLTN